MFSEGLDKRLKFVYNSIHNNLLILSYTFAEKHSITNSSVAPIKKPAPRQKNSPTRYAGYPPSGYAWEYWLQDGLSTHPTGII